MIDLHMHSTNSDGTDTPEELLKKCENLKLEYISITDHDTCKSYNDIKDINIQNIFKGKIIPGCELTTTYKGRTIEILGYGVDTTIINNFCNRFFTKEKEDDRINYCKTKAVEKLNYLGINVDINSLANDCAYSVAIYKKLLQDKIKNEKILGKGFLDNKRFIFRNGFSNPNHPLFIDVSKYFPTPKEITDIIHLAGGKSFLAHPYQYSFDNITSMITSLRTECDLDGVEAFHSSFTKEQMSTLSVYAKENNLYVSGGSDYHGTLKPEICLKTGCDNLNIPKEILQWLK